MNFAQKQWQECMKTKYIKKNPKKLERNKNKSNKKDQEANGKRFQTNRISRYIIQDSNVNSEGSDRRPYRKK